MVKFGSPQCLSLFSCICGGKRSSEYRSQLRSTTSGRPWCVTIGYDRRWRGKCDNRTLDKSAYQKIIFLISHLKQPGRVAQSVTCLATDVSLTANPGVASSIPARSHTFVEIDHEIISTIILLPSAESFMKGCCQLQAKVCARLLVNCLFKLAQEKRVVR